MDALTVLTMAKAEPRKVLWAKGGAVVHAGCLPSQFELFELLSPCATLEMRTGWSSHLKGMPIYCHVCSGDIEVWEDMQTRTLHARAVD